MEQQSVLHEGPVGPQSCGASQRARIKGQLDSRLLPSSTERQLSSPLRSSRRSWIEQHLRIKRFYGTSENAVKTQIWIAVSVYVLVAIVRKRLELDVSLHTLLQILSVTMFEKLPLQQALAGPDTISENPMHANQLNLFAI